VRLVAGAHLAGCTPRYRQLLSSVLAFPLHSHHPRYHHPLYHHPLHHHPLSHHPSHPPAILVLPSPCCQSQRPPSPSSTAGWRRHNWTCGKTLLGGFSDTSRWKYFVYGLLFLNSSRSNKSAFNISWSQCLSVDTVHDVVMVAVQGVPLVMIYVACI
jgi:hypothetical protein